MYVSVSAEDWTVRLWNEQTGATIKMLPGNAVRPFCHYFVVAFVHGAFRLRL